METAVITAATRTPIGKFCGAFTNIPAPRLGAIVIKEAVKRSGIAPSDVDEVIMGNVIQAGLGQNPARQAAIYAGIPVEIPAYTVNKVCGSGLKAVMLAAQAVRCGDAEVVVAGGMENMTRGPYLLEGARLGYRLFDQRLVDGMVRDGLWDVYNDFHMGETGERIADKFNLTREDIDRFALRSHQRAVRAMKDGKFKREIVPVRVEKGKESYVLEKDEGPREDTSLEKLAKLPPVFRKDGRITAGNASQISDGASALVVMSQRKAEELGIHPLATIVAYASSGVDPADVMEAPIPCILKLLEKTRLDLDEIDLIEHNEAFASASLAIQRRFNIPDDKFNVNGGAVALGHPIGASGARVLTTLIYALEDRRAKLGLATLCLGGGNAVGMIIRRE